MNIGEKIKAMRNAENLSQSQFCEIMQLPLSTLKKLEGGHNEPGWNTLSKLTQHPKFKKYTLWLMTDTTAPEAGQVSPAIAHNGPENETSFHSSQKIG
ncbi:MULTISPECIES: helix-turn-helix domain-containing protein [Photorhabdus]|uniref:Helix-turn-helix transcriptional regulator n=3 Tax=Photorhabdus TaxID=29487 RepID=A0A5B0X666_9GAMM|nr:MULTISPECIES: helix-turn-helix transcriptional regulator [Photorhabdus]KAA1194743.1 helix-turn-helix transcriptional regulator [Photorhabdus heterorhabditis]QXF36001.1 transcriptional regulator [Photorhabdus akhurstii]UJD77837.1 transcriptional regulator [Photorhabdus luminescens]